MLEAERKAEAARAHAEVLQAERQKHDAEAAAARQREAALARPTGSLSQSGQAKGQLAAPVAGKVIRAFGDPTDAGPATGLSYQAAPNARVTAPCAGRVAFADRVFPTPSGRIELLSEEAVRRWGVEPLPGFKPLREGTAPGGLARLHLLTPNNKNGIHSQFLEHPALRALDAGPALFLGPEDAARRGVRDGDRVRVFNARGELVLTARLDLGILQGCAVLFNGYGSERGGAVNLLSLGRETDMGYGAAFHDNLVQVEQAP